MSILDELDQILSEPVRESKRKKCARCGAPIRFPRPKQIYCGKDCARQMKRAAQLAWKKTARGLAARKRELIRQQRTRKQKMQRRRFYDRDVSVTVWRALCKGVTRQEKARA